jgi:CSLREA domain-containing protein
VNSTIDAADAQPGDGVCATDGGQCTLRAAIQEANAQPSSAISISVPAGTYILSLGVLTLTNATVVINGAGVGVTRVSGNNSSQVFNISGTARVGIQGVTVLAGNSGLGNGGGIENSGILAVSSSIISGSNSASGGGIENSGTLVLSTVTVQNNNAPGPGGGILNQGALTLLNSRIIDNVTGDSGGGIYNTTSSAVARVINSVISSNTANHYYGGGIHNGAGSTLTVVGSTINSNTATGNGGGINNNGTATVLRSTISGNNAQCLDGRGGGIENFGGGLTLVASTISGNQACYRGGAIENMNTSTLLVINTTISGNNGATSGGGIENNSGSSTKALYSTLSDNEASVGGAINNGGGAVTLSGVILANSTYSGNCSGPITESGEYNLDSGTSCGFSLSTDLTNSNPLLGPLANNSGPTQTMSLQPGSPAIDRGGTRASGCPSTDQRGVTRPDEAGDDEACDMGAYESRGIG